MYWKKKKEKKNHIHVPKWTRLTGPLLVSNWSQCRLMQALIVA